MAPGLKALAAKSAQPKFNSINLSSNPHTCAMECSPQHAHNNNVSDFFKRCWPTGRHCLCGVSSMGSQVQEELIQSQEALGLGQIHCV